MTNKFCKFLSNGYTFKNIKNDVSVSPCCWFKEVVPLDEKYTTYRKNVLGKIDNWDARCSKCEEQEKYGQYSLRQSSFDIIPDDGIAIDIHLDTECNAACVICSSHCSSLWGKENNKKNKTIYLKNENAVDSHIDKILNSVNLDKLASVKFFGGEPLFTDTHLKFIKHIPYPENVVLHYTTNASIYPNAETLALWEKFKLIIFAASIDGIEEQFDYVRWPLKWDKVSGNLIRFKENAPVNVMFRIEFTANFLNAYYFDRLDEWVAVNFSENRLGDKTDVNIHSCSNGVWDIHNMPLEIRQMILEKYNPTHKIFKLVDILKPPESLDEWGNFVKTWDAWRNNSWRVAFPNFTNVNLLTKYN